MELHNKHLDAVNLIVDPHSFDENLGSVTYRLEFFLEQIDTAFCNYMNTNLQLWEKAYEMEEEHCDLEILYRQIGYPKFEWILENRLDFFIGQMNDCLADRIQLLFVVFDTNYLAAENDNSFGRRPKCILRTCDKVYLSGEKIVAEGALPPEGGPAMS